MRGIGIGGESGSGGHTTQSSEGSLHGRFNLARSGGLNGGLTVAFLFVETLKSKKGTY